MTALTVKEKVGGFLSTNKAKLFGLGLMVMGLVSSASAATIDLNSTIGPILDSIVALIPSIVALIVAIVPAIIILALVGFIVKFLDDIIKMLHL
jgi:hypothetical protein